MFRLKKRFRNESAQAMIEYILLTGVIITFAVLVFRLMEEEEFLFKRLTSPIVKYIKFNYKYGDPKALGWDEPGGPINHIQISEPRSGKPSFRIFKADEK